MGDGGRIIAPESEGRRAHRGGVVARGVSALALAAVAAIGTAATAQAAIGPISFDLERDCPDLAPGATGPCVIELQSKLNQMGGQIVVNGVFDKPTRVVLARYQHKYGMTANGVADLHTRHSLKSDAQARMAAEEHATKEGVVQRWVCDSLPFGGGYCKGIASLFDNWAW